MRIYSNQARVRAIGLALAVLLGAGGNVRATTYSWTDLTSAVSSGANDNQVTLTYTKAGSSSTTSSSATATGFNVNSSFGAFCIDLWHIQSGNPYSATAYTLNSNGTLGSTSTSITSLFQAAPNSASVTANELTYLGTVYNAIESVTKANDQDGAAIGGLALAIWSVIDKNFAVSGAGSNVSADYTAIEKLLTGTSWTYTGTATSNNTVTIAAYNSNDTYTGATVIETNSGPGSSSNDQNLITWGTITATPNDPPPSAPEPSTLAIAGLGALAFIGYGLRRRKASGA